MCRHCAVLFDLDGTLLHSGPLLVAGYRHALRSIGRPFDKPEGWYITRRMTEVFGTDENARHAADSFRAYYWAHNHELEPFPGAVTCLWTLKNRGCRVGIVTNKEGDRARADVERIGIRDLLDVIITTEDTLGRKPDPDPLLWARRSFPNMTHFTYVGDNPVDITSARLAGMQPIAASWGYFDEELLRRRNPWYMARTLDEIAEVLEQNHDTTQNR